MSLETEYARLQRLYTYVGVTFQDTYAAMLDQFDIMEQEIEGSIAIRSYFRPSL